MNNKFPYNKYLKSIEEVKLGYPDQIPIKKVIIP